MRARPDESELLSEPILMDVHDVQKALRVGRNTALDIMHAAGPIRIGRCLRVRVEDLRRLLEAYRQEAAVR